MFLLLLVAILAIPFNIAFQMSSHQVTDNDVRLQWAFGLVRIRIYPGTPGSPSPRHEVLGRGGRRPGRSIPSGQNIIAAIRQTEFRRRIIRFIGDLWQAVRKQNVRLRVRIGLGDPADTGQLWAICGPVAGMLANAQEVSIAIEPEFVDAVLDVDASGSVRVVPLQVIYLSGALLLSPTVWRGIRQMRAVGA